MFRASRYLVRETGGNLRRNLVMTVAAVVTMVVSLAALGGVLIMRQAINKQSIQWRGGVSIAVFLSPSVTTNEVAAMRQVLADDTGTQIKKYFYVDKTEAYKEFKVIFGNEPQLVNVMSPAQMPPSYRVVPVDPADVGPLGAQLARQPGVLKVSYAKQEIDALESRFHVLRDIAVVLAIGVMVGAIALIVNTIQLAIFARRREVAVMKLVGATNWFIRIPFMLEGLIDGVIGAGLAFLAIYYARNTIASFVGSESALGPSNLYVSPHDAIMSGIVILVVGAGVGALGSAFAVRRFLRV
jgi:cell division transport system permease protein